LKKYRPIRQREFTGLQVLSLKHHPLPLQPCKHRPINTEFKHTKHNYNDMIYKKDSLCNILIKNKSSQYCVGSRCIGFSFQHSYWMWLTDRQTDRLATVRLPHS